MNELKNKFLLIAPAVVGALTATTAFASGEASVPKLAITPEMLAPIPDAVAANIGVILPVGIGIFGIIIGVSFVPKLIKKFLG